MANKSGSRSASSKPLSKVRKKPPRKLDKLVEAIDRQTIFQFGYLILSSMVQSPKVSIEVEGDERAKALADNLTARWRDSLPDALEAFKYGRACFEKTYQWNPALGIHELRKLTYLPYEYTKLDIDEDGCFDGLTLDAKGSVVTFEAPEVWWFALDPTPIQPEGRSRYRGAVLEVWADLDKLDCNDDIWLERFALGQGVAYGPSNSPDDPAMGEGNVDQQTDAGTPKDPLDDLKEAILDVKSGGVLVLRSDVGEGGTRIYGYDAVKQQPDRSALKTKREELYEEALMSFGIAPRSVIQAPDAVGSYAMAETHKDVTTHTAQGMQSQLLSSFQKYVIDKAVAINCPGAKLKIVSQPLDTGWISRVLQLVNTITSSSSLSPLIATNLINVPKLLEVAGIPVGSDVKAKLAKIEDQYEKMQQPPTPALPGFPDPFQTEATPSTPAGTSVAATALNGAQITSLVEVIQQVATKQLPLESARPILEAAFPTLSEEVLNRIVRPIIGFTPSTPIPIQASLSAPPTLGTWEQIAEEAIKESQRLAAEIIDLPQTADAGRLLRQAPRRNGAAIRLGNLGGSDNGVHGSVRSEGDSGFGS